MLRLNPVAEPTWLDLAPGVRVLVDPCSSALMVAARSSAEVEAVALDGSEHEQALVFAKAIARIAIRAWEGVGDIDGNPVEPTPALMRGAPRPLPDLRAVPGRLRRARPDAGSGKKRLVARAEWHFGGGDAYCGACGRSCPDCPYRLNAPETFEGLQVWDLALKITGQLRAIPGAALGWDLTAGFALAAALGVNRTAVAEFLPAIEAVAIRSINQLAKAQSDEQP